MIFTFRIHGQAFLPESMVLAGSTVLQNPMERVITSRYVSPTEIEVTINTDDFSAGLIHLSVLQTPMGLRSPTITVNPGLRPNVPFVGIHSADHPHAASSPVLATAPSGVALLAPASAAHAHTSDTVVWYQPWITSHTPNPVNSRTQTLRVNFFGTDFFAGATYALSGPSGAQSGTCIVPDFTQVRCDIKPTTAGVHTMIITNPSGIRGNAYLFQIVDTVFAATLPALPDPAPEQ